ncbi:sulfotransferase 6B1-like [Terrapene carolina triunguis]|uniref:sulfotransferase 6B1-like n=1 Tax=Terrapene triunguis TaxID=2587831 RepID=UPI000E777F40|nr:sulfotransferase 6B1-like [Terrapene carolina triunguis]
MDLVGPIARRTAGFRYGLVVMDYATRFPEAVPLRSTPTCTIAAELTKIARVGLPQEIFSDQGTNFMCQLLPEICCILGIKKLQMSVYHPQTVPWGSYFDYICEWSKHVDDENVMTITYEELKENRALGVKKIAEFSVLPLTEEQLQAVADRSSFQAMKENAHKTHGAFGNVLFRKGGVSDWKNLFNEDQNQEMDKMFEERLGRTKLGAKIKYEVYCKA